jgi:hypothetical protein
LPLAEYLLDAGATSVEHSRGGTAKAVRVGELVEVKKK